MRADGKEKGYRLLIYIEKTDGYLWDGCRRRRIFTRSKWFPDIKMYTSRIIECGKGYQEKLKEIMHVVDAFANRVESLPHMK